MQKNLAITVCFLIAAVAVIVIVWLMVAKPGGYTLSTPTGTTITIPTDDASPVMIDGQSLDDRTEAILKANNM